MSDVVIAPIVSRDLAEILVAERDLFPEPWSATLYRSELALRDTRRYTLIRIDGAFAAWSGVMFIGDDEAHVMTIGVVADFQGRSLATLLLAHELIATAARGVTTVVLEVAATNVSAQGLYRKFGFAPVGIRKNYYARTGEDAIVMILDDLGDQATKARLDELQRGSGWLQ